MATSVWSTAVVEPRERFAYWREAVCDAFLDLRPERCRAGPFDGHISVQRRSRIEVARIVASAQEVHRRDSHDGGWCYLNVQVRGVGLTSQGGTTVGTRPGDAVVVRTDRPFDFRFDDEFEQLSIRLPSELSSLVSEPVGIGRASSGGVALDSLLRLGSLGTERVDDAESSAMTTWLDTAVIDLVRTVLHQRRIDGPGERRSDRWDRIQADIDAHLVDPDLSPGATAHRVGVSVRALHQSFAGRPRTFTREVRERRLELARAKLADPSLAELRIRDIAADCGFVDLHHFQRVYRAAFGETPGATRAGSGQDE
ncbi:MAG: helix-turn-helix domain-containing protein [Actinomycetota bacterium]